MLHSAGRDIFNGEPIYKQKDLHNTLVMKHLSVQKGADQKHLS